MTPELVTWTVSVSDGGVKHDKVHWSPQSALRAFNEAIGLKVQRVTMYQDDRKVIEWRND